MIGFFRFLLVLLLLTVVAMTAAIVTMHYAIHGAEVSVPNFKGMDVTEAGRRAAAEGLAIHIENKLYSADVPPGSISNQSPVPGTVVRRGWRVWLTESLGPQTMAIPSEVGKDERLAAIDLRRAGLQLGIVARLPLADAPAGSQPGTVIAQSPQPNASGVERPLMNLLVASEDDSQLHNGLVMPNLVGQPFAAAALALSRVGLHQGPVQQQPAAPGVAGNTPGGAPGGVPGGVPAPAPGTVVAQNPAAGDRVDPSMAVTLTVAE